jgi:hypothetical protein
MFVVERARRGYSAARFEHDERHNRRGSVIVHLDPHRAPCPPLRPWLPDEAPRPQHPASAEMAYLMFVSWLNCMTEDRKDRARRDRFHG